MGAQCSGSLFVEYLKLLEKMNGDMTLKEIRYSFK